MACICVPAGAATVSSSCSIAQRFPWRGIVAFFTCCREDKMLSWPKSNSNLERTLVLSNMTAVVKTLVPAKSRKSFLSTNIPFLDRNNTDEFSTRFQEDFQPFSFKKVNSFPQPTPAQVDHKDLRHIKEQLTEVMESYPHHPLPKITRKKRWTTLYNSFKMQTDPAEVDFQTTQSQTFCPKPFQPPATLMRPLQSFKNIQQEETPPESTNKSTFTPHQRSPVAKATAKHLG